MVIIYFTTNNAIYIIANKNVYIITLISVILSRLFVLWIYRPEFINAILRPFMFNFFKIIQKESLVF